jgi:hypothetical protein
MMEGDRMVWRAPPVVAEDGARPVVVHGTALALLREIVVIALDRMNSGVDVSAWEAWTLGKITAVASKYPGVLDDG